MTPLAGGKSGSTPKSAGKGERGIAGWGELDFAFTDWLVGKAMVVYGPSGHLTVQGKIAPPKRLDLMKTPKGIKQPIVPQMNIEASYGLPYIADIHVGIGVSLNATAELGPIYMTDLAIEGLYSTDPAVMNAFSITGALRAQAHAGLELDVKGYAGLRILKHSVNVGAGIKGEAGIRAYAEARPTLGYRELATPTAGKQGEYYLKGHLEMAAQPVLALGGRLFVELDSPWWSPAPDKTWEWPIGNLEYPLPTQLGVGADIDYVVGSNQWPDVKLTKPSFDPSKFVDTMMDDRLPAKSGKSGDQSKPGSWQGVAPTKPTAAPPTLAKRPVVEPKAPAGAGPGKPRKGKQTPQEQKNVPASKDVAARWNAGLEAIGELRKRSEKDPETSTEIQQHLAELKARHGFTKLSADRAGDQWLVDAEMNPKKKDIPIKADAKEQEGAGADGKKDAKNVGVNDEKARRSALDAKVKERDQTVDRLLRAVTYDKAKYGHFVSSLSALKQPLRQLRDDIRVAHGEEELQLISGDVKRALKEIDLQLETYAPLLADADQKRDKAESAIDEDRKGWKDRERWENAKRAVSAILAAYKTQVAEAIPGAVIKFRGSLATGWKGPHKVDKDTGAAQRFNPSKFDCDAFVEVPVQLWTTELVSTRILEKGASWAKLADIPNWKRTGKLIAVQEEIRNRLVGIDGYEKDAGQPHFDMTIQTDLESLSKLQAGNVYPTGALERASAHGIERELPDARTRDSNKPGKAMPETNEEI